LFFGAVIALLIEQTPGKKYIAGFLFGIYPFISYWLFVGGFGLDVVETRLWGGLFLTIVLGSVGIIFSLPIGILLALGRRSELPVIRMLSTAFIEFTRAVPLITVLFMSSVMLPLFLPEGVTFDKLLRAMIGIALFGAAYMAEVVRGGLQAVPRGQYEGAMAVGLGYWQMTGLIVMPQALRIVIPGIVNTFIGLFKDTTLVIVIGLFELLNIVQSAFRDANWTGLAKEGYAFAAFVFFLFCFGMSRYSQYLERKLNTDYRR
jgi:general L-amino acid transport system permease protein